MKKMMAAVLLATLAGAVTAQTQPNTADQQAPKTDITVSRSAVCTGIQDREPSGAQETGEIKAEVGSVYFWTEIQAKDVPATVKHVWTLNGKQAAEVELSVKYPRMRTWSSKKIVAGAWKVEVVAASGEVLKAAEFKVVP
ncbi:MAG: DUF2914 domain-containing protein [Elusimicrobia bacterium]|nr:DUF2914 domain-containing protein [Elusimicrobiota bacterium]